MPFLDKSKLTNVQDSFNSQSGFAPFKKLFAKDDTSAMKDALQLRKDRLNALQAEQKDNGQLSNY